MKYQHLILFLMPTLLLLSKIVDSQEPLELKAIEGSHSVGFDQNNLGIRSFKRKKFNIALKHFHLAAMADPKRGEIYFNIALTLIELGEDSEAAKYFNTLGAPCHPMTQGEFERYHQSIKNIVKLQNYYFPWEREISMFVDYYNNKCHEALNNVTQADVYFRKVP